MSKVSIDDVKDFTPSFVQRGRLQTNLILGFYKMMNERFDLHDETTLFNVLIHN